MIHNNSNKAKYKEGIDLKQADWERESTEYMHENRGIKKITKKTTTTEKNIK